MARTSFLTTLPCSLIGNVVSDLRFRETTTCSRVQLAAFTVSHHPLQPAVDKQHTPIRLRILSVQPEQLKAHREPVESEARPSHQTIFGEGIIIAHFESREGGQHVRRFGTAMSPSVDGV